MLLHTGKPHWQFPTLETVKGDNACPPKRSQNSLRRKLAPIPFAISRVGNVGCLRFLWAACGPFRVT